MNGVLTRAHFSSVSKPSLIMLTKQASSGLTVYFFTCSISASFKTTISL